MKYKVGDEVVVVGYESLEDDIYTGQKGYVTRTYKGVPYPYCVVLTGKNYENLFKEDELALATTKATTVLDEAKNVTEGARRKSYGHPREHLKSLAEHWTAYLQRRGILPKNKRLEPKDTAMMMVLLKVDREANSDHRDNLVDICGWARVKEMLGEPYGDNENERD